jgi:hypothetical protein
VLFDGIDFVEGIENLPKKNYFYLGRGFLPVVFNNCNFKNIIYRMLRAEKCSDITFKNSFFDLNPPFYFIEVSLEKYETCNCYDYTNSLLFENNTL